MQNIFEDMLREWLAYENYLNPRNRSTDNGFKTIIKRPHNVYIVRESNNPDSEIVGYKLEVVTTPFKKEDVKVNVKADVLTISCGPEKKLAEEQNNEFVVCKSISEQSFTFSLRLNKINTNGITAKVEDGILTVYLPVIRDDAKQIEVKVN